MDWDSALACRARIASASEAHPKTATGFQGCDSAAAAEAWGSAKVVLYSCFWLSLSLRRVVSAPREWHLQAWFPCVPQLRFCAFDACGFWTLAATRHTTVGASISRKVLRACISARYPAQYTLHARESRSCHSRPVSRKAFQNSDRTMETSRVGVRCAGLRLPSLERVSGLVL